MSKKETIKTLKDFNAHLRHEVHELKDKLKSSEEKAQGFFHEMVDAQLENYDLNCEIEKLKAENAKLKSQKGSIFTGPSKRETELERQLKSECMRADELSEQLEKYEKTKKGVKGRDNT